MKKNQEESYAIPVVGALILNPKNKLFLMKSTGKFGSDWIIPGGKIRFGESMEDALEREIIEETNLRLFDINLLGAEELIEKDRHFIFLEFLAFTKDNKIKLNYEANEYGWFGEMDLKQISIAKPTQELIDKYLIPLKLLSD